MHGVARSVLLGLLLRGVLRLSPVLAATAALGAGRYDEGASDGEIRIGNTNPYSGPASAYGAIGKTLDAYFQKVNDGGGVNGRKITFISYDDGYSPPRTRELVRKLVEQDRVLLVFQTLGTPSNTAIRDYLNERKVPQLFVSSGASKWGDPKGHPWTIGYHPDYAPRPSSMPSTSWRTCRMPRSPCSCRTTTTAGTTSTV
jgi:branched-chain amino acid transport system substrate-binding protein